jgi:hypothetical protein
LGALACSRLYWRGHLRSYYSLTLPICCRRGKGCFNCGALGHLARDCPERWGLRRERELIRKRSRSRSRSRSPHRNLSPSLRDNAAQNHSPVPYNRSLPRDADAVDRR